MQEASRTAITLDYELYFGANPGTVQRCLLDPTKALLRLARRGGFKLVFFVDAGFVFRLGQQSATSTEVRLQFDQVRRQLADIVKGGHDIQLHVHPHWEDSHWDGERWAMDTHRYRIHDFADADVKTIFSGYKRALSEASQYADICAYRAGGWAVQPFSKIAVALRENGIFVDSSVMPGAHAADSSFGYDFRAAPTSGTWRFATDPNCEEPSGQFLEIPIACVNVSPWTKLSSAISKRLGPKYHAIYGDGFAAHADSVGRSFGRLGRLFNWKPMPVMIDGFKAVLLERAYLEHMARRARTFVVIGHPKAITPFALDCLEAFMSKHKPETYSYPQLRDGLAGV